MTSELPSFAPLDHVPVSDGRVPRAAVVAEARAWLRTPYIHQHRAKGHGVDCAGLIIGVARALALVAPSFDVNGYSPTPDGTSMLRICDQFLTRIPLEQLQPGDVLVYQFSARLGPQHLGIIGDYLHGGLTLIQALGTADGKGSVIEWRITRRRWWTPVQAYSIPGVA
jgi:cell wall-associated NlpC family hydrolase